jgi:hypothetical protein
MVASVSLFIDSFMKWYDQFLWSCGDIREMGMLSRYSSQKTFDPLKKKKPECLLPPNDLKSIFISLLFILA